MLIYRCKKIYIVIRIETIFWLKAKAKWKQKLDSYCLKIYVPVYTGWDAFNGY